MIKIIFNFVGCESNLVSFPQNFLYFSPSEIRIALNLGLAEYLKEFFSIFVANCPHDAFFEAKQVESIVSDEVAGALGGIFIISAGLKVV